MDSDCLIKLTKAGLKEDICQHYEVVIPVIVKKEVVDAGKSKGVSDAEVIDKNLQKGIIQVIGKELLAHVKGDQALIELYKRGQHHAIATDDAKLIRFLRSTGIPYVLPGLLIYSLYRRNIISKEKGMKWLKELSALISEDEFSMVRFLLEEKT